MEQNSSDWLFGTTFGQPIVKDGCGVFGVIRKPSRPKIANDVAVKGISCIKYRGSNLGAGYACVDTSNPNALKFKAFVRNDSASKFISDKLSKLLGDPLLSELQLPGDDHKRSEILNLVFPFSKDQESGLDTQVDEINASLILDGKIEGRIFSYGRFVSVFKEVGYPLEVAEMFGLDKENQVLGDLWIAHTRQPTNSPGSSPIWSHPFCSLDCAIVHNGDISSFGANLELLGSVGFESHVGTDSEVIARLLNFLIRHEGLSVVEAAKLLTNPFEENAEFAFTDRLSKYRGARLDGPFAVVAGYADSNDAYLIALIDRSKFRPILIGEDENCFYVASEENQIRLLSPDALVWAPDPGSFFIASMKQGLIASGTRREIRNNGKISRSGSRVDSSNFLDSTGMSFSEINQKIREAYESGASEIGFRNVSGQRYIGIGISPRASRRNFKIRLDGYPGNCLANLNDGASFEVYGNVADDLADTMHSGRVVIHGSARDVLGQALQGGDLFVKGSVGNRAAIQMREYKNSRPFIIIGETADDYLAEYMAGGVVIVLNLSNDQFPVGKYLGTGMVGGTILVRGRVDETQIGLPPKKDDILNFLKAESLEGNISSETFANISIFDYPSERLISALLPENVMKRLRSLFFRGKYSKPISAEYRKLNADDEELRLAVEKMEDFFNAFWIPEPQRELILNSGFTVIRTMSDEEKETPVPPQEVPVEE